MIIARFDAGFLVYGIVGDNVWFQLSAINYVSSTAATFFANR